MTHASHVALGLSDLAVRKPRILLIDDVPRFRLVMSDSLRERGYDVMEATTEHAAIAAVEAEEPEIDLVFVNTGAGSGISALRLLRVLAENLPDVPVFLSSCDAKTKQAAHELYPRAIIATKPIDEVTTRVRTLVAPWTRVRQAALDF